MGWQLEAWCMMQMHRLLGDSVACGTLSHLQNDQSRVLEALKHGLEDPPVVVGYAVVCYLVPELVCLGDGLDQLLVMEV